MCNVRLVLHRFAGFNYSQGYIFSKICQRCVYKTCGSKRKRKEGQRGNLEGEKRKGGKKRKKRKKQLLIIFPPKYYQTTIFMSTNFIYSRTNLRKKRIQREGNGGDGTKDLKVKDLLDERPKYKITKRKKTKWTKDLLGQKT